jgi:acetoin utilization protein AcuB
MLVGERMTCNPVTIREEVSIDDGLPLMRQRKVRRLPVLDGSGRMVGIVSDKRLLQDA